MRVTIKLNTLEAVTTIMRELNKGRVKLKSLDVPTMTATFKCKNMNTVNRVLTFHQGAKDEEDDK